MKILFNILLIACLLHTGTSTPESDFLDSLKSLQTERSLKGLQVQVSKDQKIIFNANIGVKNEAG